MIAIYDSNIKTKLMALDTSYLIEVFNHVKAFSIMGQHVSRTDFEWTDQEEPHAKRRGEILSKLELLLLLLVVVALLLELVLFCCC